MAKRRWLLLDILFLGILGLYVLAGRDLVPFHGDESTFIAMSRDYHYLVHQHAPEKVVFRWPPVDEEAQFLRVLNGSINPLTIGLAWDLAGMTVDDLNTGWNWEIVRSPSVWQWHANVRLGHKPADDLLRVARTPSALFAALSVVMVFAIARRLTPSRPAAWTASLLYATNPAILVNGRRAMQEGAMLFTTALVILIALVVIQAQTRSPRWRTLAGWTMALGAAGGLAVASKHTAAVVVAAAFLAVLLAPKLRRQGPPAGIAFDRQHICLVLAAGVLVELVFMLLMPVWWFWPPMLGLIGIIAFLLTIRSTPATARTWIVRGAALLLMYGAMNALPTVWYDLIRTPIYILEGREWLVNRQVGRFGGQHTPGERLDTLVKEAFVAGAQYYEDPAWATFPAITAQIDSYQRSGLAGRGGGPVWAVVQIALLVAGLAALFDRWRDGTAVLIALWLLIAAVTLLLTNPLPWQRYYLILHAPLAVIAGLGLPRLAIVARCRFAARRGVSGWPAGDG